MKKFLFILTIFCILALPTTGLAQCIFKGPAPLQKVITNIENAIWDIFMAVSVIFIVYAGVLFLTASGKPDKLEQAKQAFLWGVIGVAVGILASSICNIIDKIIHSS